MLCDLALKRYSNKNEGQLSAEIKRRMAWLVPLPYKLVAKIFELTANGVSLFFVTFKRC